MFSLTTTLPVRIRRLLLVMALCWGSIEHPVCQLAWPKLPKLQFILQHFAHDDNGLHIIITPKQFTRPDSRVLLQHQLRLFTHVYITKPGEVETVTVNYAGTPIHASKYGTAPGVHICQNV